MESSADVFLHFAREALVADVGMDGLVPVANVRVWVPNMVLETLKKDGQFCSLVAGMVL